MTHLDRLLVMAKDTEAEARSLHVDADTLTRRDKDSAAQTLREEADDTEKDAAALRAAVAACEAIAPAAKVLWMAGEWAAGDSGDRTNDDVAEAIRKVQGALDLFGMSEEQR